MILPKYSWNEYESIIEKIGKKSMNGNEGKDIDSKLSFLMNLGLIKKDIDMLTNKSWFELTDTGKKYYVNNFCTNQKDEAAVIIKNLLEKSKPVLLIKQVLWGKPNLTKENLKNLLCHHDIAQENSNLGSFLSLLNKFKIISYSKKHNKIRIITEPEEISTKEDYFVSESKPYSNHLKIKQMIQEAEGSIFWIEKHFSPKIYELLSYYADGNLLNKIKLLTGIEHITEESRKEYKRLKKELSNRKINLTHRIIIDKKLLAQLHGRWFISDNYTYKIPPIDTILQGQTDEIIKRDKSPDLKSYWDSSCDFIDDWNKITNSIGDTNG